MSRALFGQNLGIGAAPIISATGAFEVRVQDAITRMKQELGVDELLLAVRDAKRIASVAVRDYLTTYGDAVERALDTADDMAAAKFQAVEAGFQGAQLNQAYPAVGAQVPANQQLRSGKNVEKLVALAWKSSYEIEMEDVNAQMPLAQQIVSKYMTNFSAKPKMK
jgi:hypothetical protein